MSTSLPDSGPVSSKQGLSKRSSGYISEFKDLWHNTRRLAQPKSSAGLRWGYAVGTTGVVHLPTLTDAGYADFAQICWMADVVVSLIVSARTR